MRLTGCPLRCSYCDTAYAFSGGEWLALETILEQVAGYAPGHVCVTGGEPLAQKGATELLQRLCDTGYQVSLETSGALDIAAVDPRVSRVVDVKTPGSGESARNRITSYNVCYTKLLRTLPSTPGAWASASMAPAPARSPAAHAAPSYNFV